jgi:aldehyde:ferredoxin oxidoreductase
MKDECVFMSSSRIYGYAGKILRVDLTSREISPEVLDEALLRKYVGGASLGIKFIYDEVPPDLEWCDSENRLVLSSGPLGGTRIGGSGAIAVVTKGAMTNGICSTQANGFFGAYLRSCHFDGIIVQGTAPNWCYLYVHEGWAELRDASHLVGKGNYEVDRILKDELQKRDREISILSIGPAGENRVRFGCIFADLGHVAAHNGAGAVMGCKKLKAIVVDRVKSSIQIKDEEAFSQADRNIRANTLADKYYGGVVAKQGTIGGIIVLGMQGALPIKNYTTSIHAIDPAKLETYTSESIRIRCNAKRHSCWACGAKHCHMMEIPDGKYGHRQLEEPEYEQMAAFSSLIGIDDVTTTLVLAAEVDDLGMDANEAGWVISWVMECYEKRILGKESIGGLEMTWGNGEAVMAMLRNIANREGFGNVLAEGVMRAAQHVGGEAPKLAIHSQKGNTPRGHDHRVQRLELFDTCVSNLGTLEAHGMPPFKLLGLPAVYDSFDPMVVSTLDAKIKGAMVFEDSLVTCRFQTATALDLLCQAINAATGWDMDFQEAMVVGRRAVNLARAYNLLSGIGAELDAPSMRYGSTPLDGVAAGRDIMPHWDKMLRNYYNLMGWDEATGKPLPQTLIDLGLDFVVPRLWR